MALVQRSLEEIALPAPFPLAGVGALPFGARRTAGVGLAGFGAEKMRTPGSWRFDSHENIVRVGTDGAVIAECIRDEDGALLAAAPELLDWLKTALQAIEKGMAIGEEFREKKCGFTLDVGEFTQEYIVGALKATIAKAEGR